MEVSQHEVASINVDDMRMLDSLHLEYCQACGITHDSSRAVEKRRELYDLYPYVNDISLLRKIVLDIRKS